MITWNMLREKRRVSESLEPWQTKKADAYPSYTNLLRRVPWHLAAEYTHLRMLNVWRSGDPYSGRNAPND